MRRIYPDSSVVIYFVERTPGFRASVSAAFRRAYQVGCQFVVSDLTYLECRVLPLRANDTRLLGLFDTFFGQPIVDRRMLATDIVEHATALRAYHGLRVPDALHLATALKYQCDMFWTGDRRLAGVAATFVQVS